MFIVLKEISIYKKIFTLIVIIGLNKKINEMKADGTLYAILVENGLDRNDII